jgi:teichuronic acid biosynthesis glycosyltransferase TuaC
LRVLIMTKLFPNRIEPFSSPFNRQQFAELAGLCEVELLATIPWFPSAKAFARWSRAGRLVDVPKREHIDGLRVLHPRFAYVPKLASGLSGPLYVASLAATALRYRGKVDVVLGSWAYPDGFAAVVLARMLGTAAVIKLHGSDIHIVARRPGPRRALKWAFQRAQRVVAVSGPLRDEAIALGAPPDHVDIVPNGVDRGRFFPQDRVIARRALGLPLEGKIVLYVGNLERHKGPLDLICACAAMTRSQSDVSLVMVGTGAAIGECRSLAAQLGARVSFVGGRPHEEIPQWMAACDLFTLPSWNEGTPNVVLEALACGRRAVATRVGGTPDVLTSELLGTLVPPRDTASLGAAIEEALFRPYDPAVVSATVRAPDWAASAGALQASLAVACAARARGSSRKGRIGGTGTGECSHQVTR